MRIFAVVSLVALLVGPLQGQQLSAEELAGKIAADGCVSLHSESVRVCDAGWEFEGNRVEALLIRNVTSSGRSPAILLVPGFQQTAFHSARLGVALAAEGFVALAVTQRGFGGSSGEPDFVGPATIRTLEHALDRLKALPGVDPERIAVFGHSRGGMASSLLAVRRNDLSAAILSAGIYDLLQSFCEAPIPAMRDTMLRETGMTQEAIEMRSSIRLMRELQTPVLILHGDKDGRAPIAQALNLRAELTKLEKPFEIRIYPDAGHALPLELIAPDILKFLRSRFDRPANSH